jgi:hypothetical protein
MPMPMRAPHGNGGGGVDVAVAGERPLRLVLGSTGQPRQARQVGSSPESSPSLSRWSRGTPRIGAKRRRSRRNGKLRSETSKREQRRHEATLAGERERIDDRLQHQRKLVDVADLREILEHSLAAVDELVRVAADSVFSDAAPSKELRDQVFIKYWSMNSGMNALQIRLADDDRILVAHRALVGKVHDVMTAFLADDAPALSKASSAVTATYRQLVEAAKDSLRSHL